MSTPERWTLAIDLGTRTSVGVMRVGNATELVEVDGATAIPSGVFLDPVSGPLIGTEAATRAPGAPEAFEPAPRARLQDGQVSLAGFDLPATELVAAVLERIHHEACRLRGNLPIAVRLTYPAGWAGSPKLGALGLAAVTAGIENVRFAPEAVAIGQHILETEGLPTGARVAIFDLSDGSLDCAVLENTWWGLVPVGTPGGLDPMREDQLGLAASELAATVDSAGLTSDQLHGVYLARDAAALPAAGDAVRSALGVEPRKVPDGRAAVALGAARADDAVFATIGSLSMAARRAAVAHNKAAGRQVAASGATAPRDFGEEEQEGELWWHDQGIAITAVFVAAVVVIWFLAWVINGG